MLLGNLRGGQIVGVERAVFQAHIEVVQRGNYAIFADETLHKPYVRYVRISVRVENAVVNLTGETADVVVPEADLEDAKRAQIEDIIKRKTGIAAENIVITPLDQTEDTGEESSSMEENADETAAYDSTDEADTTYEDQETSTDQVIQTDGIYD